MKIIKRSGSESQFDMEKIISAVIRANDSVAETERMSKEQIAVIAANMRTICEGMNRALSVEEIQDLVENQIMNQRAFSVARIISLIGIKEHWCVNPIQQMNRF